MKTSRTKNSIYNSISSLLINLSITILSFLTRTIFIRILGEQCLGLDGLFSNILSLLSLAELGFSSAVSFSLYEPLAKNDIKKISQIIYYFKNMYRKVAITILIIGLCLLPFMGKIVKDYTIADNIYLIYVLYLLNTVSSYFVNYSATLLEADQKNYKLIGFKLSFNVLTYGSQIIILLFTKNFILYLLTQFVLRQIERMTIHFYIKKMYSEIDFSTKQEINQNDKKTIKQNIKGIIFHKVGNYAVNGTDNILISSIVSISMTGLYSNYLSIVAIFRNLINAVICSTTSSFGNLNVLEKVGTKKKAFDLVNFLCYFMTGFVVVGLFFCINPFINFWIGDKYILDISCVIVICINFYLNCIMLPITAVKSSAGLYYIDRYVPITRAIINLGVSIIFGKIYGLIGILLGTAISAVLTVNVTKPYVIYKYVFKTSCTDYFIKLLKNVFLIIISIIIISFIISELPAFNNLYQIIIHGITSVLVYTILFIISYFKTSEYKYFKDKIFLIIKNKRK